MGLALSIVGLDKIFKFNLDKKDVSPQKKKQLRINIAKKISTNYIPLHAVLLKGVQNILISGPSQSGKSTLAKYLKTLDYQTYANDFVMVWNNGKDIMAGDLNYQDVNKGKIPLKIDRVIFLDSTDKRDIFHFNKKEAICYYKNSFDTKLPFLCNHIKQKKIFDKLYEKHIVLGNRVTQLRWRKVLDRLLKNKHVIKNIGIIGVGTVGEEIASLLLTLKWIKVLNLYSRNTFRLKGIILDLKSANPNIKINLSTSTKTLIKNSDLVILAFKSEKKEKSKQERFQRLKAHKEIIWTISREIRKINLNAYFFVLTNPVDFLSWLLYFYTNLNDKNRLDWNGIYSDQVYGVGLGLDYNRMKSLSNNKLELVGEHGENLILTKAKKGKLKLIKSEKFLKKVINYSPMIRKYVDRTQYGPAHEVINLVKVIRNNKGFLRVSTLNKYGVYLGDIVEITNGIPGSKYDLSLNLKNELDILINSYKNLQKMYLK